MLAVWVASDWPIHDVAERYNYSVHMVQHLVFTMVAAPLLLLGTPAWLMRYLLPGPAAPGRPHRWRGSCRRCLIFNLVLVLTHWPLMVNASLESGSVHFALHVVLFVSSLIVWLPVVSPLPEIPRLAPVMRMLYLFTWSIVPTVPASFLTFGSDPAVQVLRGRAAPVRADDARRPAARGSDHEDRCRTPTLDDHRRSVLPLGAEEERANTPRHGLGELDRELTQMGLRR